MSVSGFVCKLTKGAYSLDLTSGRYALGLDFVPPPQSVVPQYAAGTSLNRTGGAALVGTKAVNREWGFGLTVTGDSEADVADALAQVQSFLNLAGDQNEPLYLEMRGNADVDVEPVWGQYGANKRYEIVYGSAAIADTYGTADFRSRTLHNCRIALTIKPFALGKRQALGSAKGGILEDVYHSAPGMSHGVIVPEATTNLATNPVFGNATWDTGWTANAGLLARKNNDPRFILFGFASARIEVVGTVPGGKLFYYQQTAVSSGVLYNVTAYVKKPDGSAVTANDCAVVLDSAVSSTYTDLGNGWYEVNANAPAVVTATVEIGLAVSQGIVIYLAGLHAEQKNGYGTALCYGDMLGCAWTGTAHASTTSRTAGRLRISASDAFSFAQGTIRLIYHTRYANTYIQEMPFFQAASGTDSKLKLRFSPTADDIILSDLSGSNSACTAALTFSGNTRYVIHCTYGAGSMKVYLDGILSASTANYATGSSADFLYVGSDAAGASQAHGPFLEFATFEHSMTASQVADDAGNLAQLISGHYENVAGVPWLWTKDGDDIVDNCDDSTRDDWAVIGGIPGTIESETEIQGAPSPWTGGAQGTPLWLSLFRAPRFDNPSTLYTDLSGVASGADSGGEHQDDTVTTAVKTIGTSATVTDKIDLYGGLEYYLFTRLSDAGSNLQLALAINIGGVQLSSGYASVSIGASFFLAHTLALSLPDRTVILTRAGYQSRFSFLLLAQRTTGSATLSTDYFMLLPRPLLRLAPQGASAFAESFILRGRAAQIFNSSVPATDNLPTITGDIIELQPARYNILRAVMGETTSVATITYTLTFSKVIVTPRYALL